MLVGVFLVSCSNEDELNSIIDEAYEVEKITQISSGAFHTCALLSIGNVRCWGRLNKGQLGLGNTEDIGDDELPTSVSIVDLGGETVRQIAAGSFHTCALLSTGNVHCWGDAYFGQLGMGNKDDIGDDELPTSTSAVSIIP